MSHSAASLAAFYLAHRFRGEPLVLATVAHTLGSTYRKAGAQMLIAADGTSSGLLSGGCLEGDLAERSREVLRTGAAMIAEYDTRTSEDLIWGIGLGCEGLMRIALTRIGPDNDYQPFRHIHEGRERRSPAAFALAIESANPVVPVGKAFLSGETAVPAALDAAFANLLPVRESRRFLVGSSKEIQTEDAKFLVVQIDLPLRLLLLGAGPDVAPLIEIAGLLGWHVTVCDHRPAYAVAERFPNAHEVKLSPASQLASVVNLQEFDAAVVMSHHLPSDQAYLATLAESTVGYVGLLGPAPRRERLLAEIGTKAGSFGDRLRGPVGLDIGAQTPEAIALSIVAEIQAYVTGKSGGPYSQKVAPGNR
jgi:xanthine dehydrogenase accessory factor